MLTSLYSFNSANKVSVCCLDESLGWFVGDSNHFFCLSARFWSHNRYKQFALERYCSGIFTNSREHPSALTPFTEISSLSAARFLAAPDDHRITQAYSTWVWCVIPLIAQARRLGYPASAHILMCFVATVSAFLTVYTSTIQFWGKWNSCGWFEGATFLIFSLPFGHWLQSLTATGRANELIQDIKSRRVSGHGNIPLPAMSGRARWRGHRGTFYFCSFETRQVIIWSLKGATGIMKTNLMVLRCEKSVPIRLAFWVMAKVNIYIYIFTMYA